MNPTESAAPDFVGSHDPDEAARAELYGALSRLWLSAPDAALLQRWRAAAAAPPGGALLEQPWLALSAALQASTAEAAADEYDALFLGVGRPELLLYGSYYLSGFLNERPLAALRADLAALGLQRDPGRGETEDHVACVFEVMRYLIVGDDAAVCNLLQQQRFFRAHVQSWVENLCDAVDEHPRAVLWREVANFTRQFVQLETQAFDLLEA